MPNSGSAPVVSTNAVGSVANGSGTSPPMRTHTIRSMTISPSNASKALGIRKPRSLRPISPIPTNNTSVKLSAAKWTVDSVSTPVVIRPATWTRTMPTMATAMGSSTPATSGRRKPMALARKRAKPTSTTANPALNSSASRAYGVA